MNIRRIAVLVLVLSCMWITSAQDDNNDEFDDNDEISVEEEQTVDDVPSIDVYYESPTISDPSRVYLAEHFDSPDAVDKVWIRSKAKKDGVSEDIAKYDGQWNVEASVKDSLPSDLGLVLKSKAQHAAISARLTKPFVFDKKSLVVQYEVVLQDGQECGGAYLKLLSRGKATDNLEQFTDKTPYTIMFGPDKCGNDHKLHFIFKHRNPLNGSLEEKHCKKPKDRLEETYRDKLPHLYTLIVNPDNTFEVRVDKNVVNSGSLLEDFTPPVNPTAEIDDPADKKPDDWDEREKIADPDASKPDDWDETAPAEISDDSAVKPDGWLDDEPETMADPDAVKPDDWDSEIDGEWEAPLIDNPHCKEAVGCGKWHQPMVPNPEYKGKWRAPYIDNPNYKGKWRPRKIPNPHFFEDTQPFKMDSIAAIGFEIWSMSKDILFDNVIITDELSIAEEWAAATFDLKRQKIAKDSESVFTRLLNYAEENPYMWAVYIIVISLPVIVIIAMCCKSSPPSQQTEREDDVLRESAERKKTDAMTEDDDPVYEEKEEEDEDKENSDKEKNSDNEDEDDGGDQEEAQDQSPISSQGEGDVPRKRRARKE